MEDTVFALLLRDIAEKKSSIELFLASGNAKSYEEYCRITGEYSALVKIHDDIKELEKRFIEE